MDFLHNLKQSLRYQVAPYPDLFIPIYNLLAPDRNRDLLVSKETEIVIEGFPRSGNTFAVVAFLHAQSKEVKIAHHLHVEAQILEGIKRRLPVLVLIREPIAAIRSLSVRYPNISVDSALEQYVRFYTIVAGVSNKVVIADFNEITTNFGQVIMRVNKKFGRDFSVFEHTPKNVGKVFQEIEQINQLVDDGKETHVARPSTLRQKEYQNLTMSFSVALKEEAMLLYQNLLQNPEF